MKKTKFVLGINPKESEIVDTIADIIETAAVVEKELGDGFQISDIFKIAEQQDEVKDVIDSFPQFIDEFSEINPDVAKKAIEQAEKRAISKVGELGKISRFALALLRNVSSNYSFLQLTVENGKKELDAWKELFGRSKKDFATA